MSRRLAAVILYRLGGFAIVLAAAVLLAALGWVRWAPVLSLTNPDPPRAALLLLTAQGEPFARRGVYREAPVDAAGLPEHVVAAFLAIEDRRFYRHGGIDWRGIARAVAVNTAAGGVEQGGSTITQQLAKMAFAGTDQSFARKLEEALIALRLEQHYSKDAILSAYLDRAYFGDGTYGLAAAARHYFAKDARELSLAEAAMLAGVVNAPSRLAPTRHLAAAQARGRVVLGAMADAGYLTAKEASAVPAARPAKPPPLLSVGGHFADWVHPQAVAATPQSYGLVPVRTTLDAALQERAEAVVARALGRDGEKGGVHQAALVAMRTDGSVVAMVGGRDYAKSPFNRAAQAQRQPGSAFKLFVYLAALRAGANGDSAVSDRPLQLAGWSPKNYGDRYRGQISLTQAFAQSSNVAAVRLTEQAGRAAVVQAARDLGLDGPIEPVPSLALGTASTSLLDLTAAYSGVAAGSYPVEATGLPAEFRGRRVPMHPAERGPLLGMLSAVVEQGTGRAARLLIPAFGKTGTSQDNRDAWFVGFAGDLIVGVWVGNDDEQPMKGVTGGGLPARIWKAFMTHALADDIAAAEAAKRAEEAERARREREYRWDWPRPWWERLLDRSLPRSWFS